MNEQEIIERLCALIKKNHAFTVGKVTAVNGNKCTVQPTNGDVELTGVKLSFDDQVPPVFTPALGSIVVVGIRNVNKTKDDAFIVQCSKYSKVTINTGGSDQTFSLAKTEKLVEELNKTNAVVSALVNAITNWTVAPGDGGAALKALATTQLTGKSVGNFSDVKNQNIQHG